MNGWRFLLAVRRCGAAAPHAAHVKAEVAPSEHLVQTSALQSWQKPLSP